MRLSDEEPLAWQVHGTVVLVEISQRGPQRTTIRNRDGNGAGLDVPVVVESTFVDGE
jgi:hypothetical protein